MIEIIATGLKKEVKPNYAPVRAGDVKHSLANIGKAQQLLGYEVRKQFEQGLTGMLKTSDGKFFSFLLTSTIPFCII